MSLYEGERFRNVRKPSVYPCLGTLRYDENNLFRVGARINPLFHRLSLIIVKRDSNDAYDILPLQIAAGLRLL